jgi:hypothetical protein
MKPKRSDLKNVRKLLRAFCLNRQTAPMAAGIEAGMSEHETRRAWRLLRQERYIEPYHGRVWIITDKGERQCP